MKCLVTGNHGYIGYILANELLKAGHEVIGYDCDYFPKEPFGRKDAFKASANIKQIIKDIRNATKEDLKGIDAVFHLAALPNDSVGDMNPEVTYDINYLATLQLATLAKRSGVKRFIFASSCSVFGKKGNKLIDETATPSPITPYGTSKLYAERALIPMSSDNFTVICMRNATCYGVSPRMRFDMVLNSLVAHAYVEKKVTVFNYGSPWRPLIHIEDVARAYILALEAPKSDVSGEVFSVGSENFQTNTLAELVAKSIQGSIIEHEEHGTKDMRSYKVSSDKIRRRLGFSPKWSAKSGIKELYDAYKDYGLNGKNLQNKEFWAGKYFNYLMQSKKVNKEMLSWKK